MCSRHLLGIEFKNNLLHLIFSSGKRLQTPSTTSTFNHKFSFRGEADVTFENPIFFPFSSDFLNKITPNIFPSCHILQGYILHHLNVM